MMSIPARERRLAVHDERPPVWTRMQMLLAAGLIAVYAAVRLAHTANFRLWFDEIFTMEVGRHDWSTLFWFVKTYDVHPPLFYVLVKLWMAIGGQSFLWLGLFGAIISIVALVPMFLLGRELRARPSELLMMLALMCVNGYLMGYAQELRGYDFLLLLSCTSLWLLVQLCNRDDAAIGLQVALGLTNLVIVYLHYYGWLLVGTEGLFLLLWNRRKVLAFASGAFVAVLAYLPWAYMVTRAAIHRVETGNEALFFIPKPDLFSVAFFYGALNGLFDAPHTTTMSVLLFAVPVLGWIVYELRRRSSAEQRSGLLFLLVFASVPVIVAFVASRLLPTAVWGQRHLIIVAIPYYMLVSVGIMNLPAGLIRRGVGALLVVWAIASGIQAIRAPYKIPAWDQLAAHIMETTPIGQGARVYALSEDAAFPLQFYLNRANRSDIRVGVIVENTPANRERFLTENRKPYWALWVPVTLINDVSELGNSFWLCVDQDGTLIGHPGTSLASLVSGRGYAVQAEKSMKLINRRWQTREVGVFSASKSAPPEMTASSR